MILPGVPDGLMGQERYKDLREADHERLIRAASNPQPKRWPWSGQVLRRFGLAIVRIGDQMVKWGLALQGCSRSQI